MLCIFHFLSVAYHNRLGDPSLFPINERNHNYQPKFLPVAALEGKHVVQVALGGEHSIFVTSDNEVYVAGQGAKGQLGTGESDGCVLPTLLRDLFNSGLHLYQAACGNSCSMILVGKFNPLTLQQRCSEIIERHPELEAALEGVTLRSHDSYDCNDMRTEVSEA
jgi:hypothetical protein